MTARWSVGAGRSGRGRQLTRIPATRLMFFGATVGRRRAARRGRAGDAANLPQRITARTSGDAHLLKASLRPSPKPCGLKRTAGADKRGRSGLCSGEVAQFSVRCREANVHQIADQSRKRSCCGWMMPDATRWCSTPIPHRICNVVYGSGVLLIMTKANLLMRCARFANR